MIDVGRICVKTAGRDAGLKCVVVDVIDNNFVLIDGETRRRKCNILHLEPLDRTVEIKKGASHAEVAKAFESLNYKVHAPKTKKKTVRPRKARRSKLAGQKPAPAKAAAPSKAAAPTAATEKPAAKKPAVAKKAAPAVQKKLE
ncbi:MAG: 50S ribosomal protein L14e [Candidatus Woesearchaeota archaeon]